MRGFLAGFGVLCRLCAADALAQRVHQIDHVLATRSLLRGDGFAGALLVDEIDESSFVLVFELVRLEVTRLLVDDVPGEIEHVLGDFDVLDIVEIFRFGAHFVGIPQQRSHQALVERLERDDVLAVGQHHPSDRDLVHLADGFADDGEGVVADLAVRTQVIGTDQIARIDLAAVDELVDLDGPRRFQRDVLELLLRHLDEGVGVDLVALDDVLVGDLLAGVGIHLGVLDAVAGLPVELVEGDLFGFRRGRIERYRTGDEGKTQEAFPVSAGGHDAGNSRY